MITVIIPAINEVETIDKVVAFSRSAPDVTEVLVIDDKLLDINFRNDYGVDIGILIETHHVYFK